MKQIFYMLIWVINNYLFLKELYSKGVYDHLYYYRDIKNLKELLTESIGNKRGKILVTGKKKQTKLNIIYTMAY